MNTSPLQERSLIARLVAVVALCQLTGASVQAASGPTAPLYACTFASGQWDRADWIPVKNPRSEHFGGWLQQDGCIANEVPDQATPEEFQGKRAPETYSSMVLKERITGNVAIIATMAFAHTMAPLIVLAPELRESVKGKEYGENFGIVLFNEGGPCDTRKTCLHTRKTHLHSRKIYWHGRKIISHRRNRSYSGRKICRNGWFLEYSGCPDHKQGGIYCLAGCSKVRNLKKIKWAGAKTNWTPRLRNCSLHSGRRA